ncbi:Inner membrane lipoprotein YiaD precursor [Thiorhodovibrio winogradskyi]|uniref:Inner membrane lipoprotein YiaD n=1 Tax=Thiorhodovibrio winogradskyi TaxID=77007 RepID=A0ABZ0SBP0_9GAMM|nr:OmpA family protein [Thiorhodovibrio winogradskyi]
MSAQKDKQPASQAATEAAKQAPSQATSQESSQPQPASALPPGQSAATDYPAVIADPCARQIRMRTTAILSLLAALFAVGLIAMEVIERTREAAGLGKPVVAGTQGSVIKPAGDTQEVVAWEEFTRPDQDLADLDLAQARIAELEQERERLLAELADHRVAVETGELALLEARRQLEAARDSAVGNDTGTDTDTGTGTGTDTDTGTGTGTGTDTGTAAPAQASCGDLLSDLGALGLDTRLTDAGLRIALSSNELRFPSGSAELPADAGRERLDALATWLSAYPAQAVRVIGYTDASGNTESNQRLSQARAAAVRGALINLGVAPERLAAEGRGERESIADNATPEGRERNRRVELLLVSAAAD